MVTYRGRSGLTGIRSKGGSVTCQMFEIGVLGVVVMLPHVAIEALPYQRCRALTNDP